MLKKTTIYVLLLLSISLSSLFASTRGPSKKDIEKAQIVVVGDLVSLTSKVIVDGKAVTSEEAYKIQEERIGSVDITDDAAVEKQMKSLRWSVVYTATINVVEHLRGPIRGKVLVFEWEDLFDSMCPHIQVKSLKEKVGGMKKVWITTAVVPKAEFNHTVNVFLADEKQIEALRKKLHNKSE
jgi:hypothetical protein